MDVESQASKRQQRLRVYQQWQGNEVSRRAAPLSLQRHQTIHTNNSTATLWPWLAGCWWCAWRQPSNKHTVQTCDTWHVAAWYNAVQFQQQHLQQYHCQDQRQQHPLDRSSHLQATPVSTIT